MARHLLDMRSSREILDALKAKKVTQKAIAEVLGVEQPNAAALYSKKKPRKLSYDEGIKLIDRFRLATEAPERSSRPNEELLIPILDEIAERLAGAEVEESILRPLAGALARYLDTIEKRPAIHDNRDALEAVALAVTSPPPPTSSEASLS